MGYQWRRFDKRNIRRRVRSRMESLRIYEAGKYTLLVNRDAAERAILDSLLRVTITRFFRNSWLWSELGSLILQVQKNLGEDKLFKAWSAGCAGGEEPFSLAMLLDDLNRSGHLECSWNILGSDTDPASLKRAFDSDYKWGSVREIPRHLRDRWFHEADGLWTLDDEVRSLVNFRQHDLITTAPPGRFNLVFMRNSILTYNTEEVQDKILARLHGCLEAGGYLIIGRTETMPEGIGFEEVSKCIYRKRE